MTDTLRAVMRGESHRAPPSATMVARLGRDGSATRELIPDSVEFPRVDPRRIGQRYRQTWSVLIESVVGGPSGGVIRRDLESGARDVYRFGPDALVEEHVYVPRAGGGEGDGWLIGTHLDVRKGVTRLAVFDAMKLSDGPVAVASLPYALPLGLHGNFVASSS
jgi:carotenoid cleavage dioxygenase